MAVWPGMGYGLTGAENCRKWGQDAQGRLIMPEAATLLATLFADVAQVFGLSRPAGQCFSAIWRAAAPPCADDLVAGLGLSRSNVSTALKELRGWGMISIVRASASSSICSATYHCMKL